MDLRKEFKDFMEVHSLKQAHIARSLGVSPSVISQWLKGEYRGDNASLEEKVKAFMHNFTIKKGIEAKEEIKQLKNLKSAHFVMDEAVVLREMAVLYGKPGSGKTVAVKEWVKKHPEALFIEVVPGMSVVRVLKLIAQKLGIDSSATTDELVLAIAKEFLRRDSVLVIDEAEHLTTNALEAIRRIHDFSKVPVILAGTYGLIKNLKGARGELLQLFSRINGKWEFRELDSEDMELLFGEFAPIIARYTLHLRRAANLYKKAKRFADMEGEALSAKHIELASSMIFLD